MGKSAPAAPDPYETAAAQTGTNVSTAVANAFLGNVNQVTPYGSLNYGQTGTYKWTDPSTDKTYEIPTFTATQTLTPDGQAIQDATIGAQKNLAATAQTASGNLLNLMGGGLDLSGAPAAGTVPSLQTGIAGAGKVGTVGAAPGMQQVTSGNPSLQTSLGGAGKITSTYGTDFGTERQRVEDAIMSRAQSGLDADKRALEQRLADQGIGIGSAAYQAAMDDYGRQVNDMRTSAILAGGQEQSRLAGLEADRASFENAAQAQRFGQNAQRASFGNDARTQELQNLLGLTGFNNSAAQQDFANDLARTTTNNAAQDQRFNQNAQRAAFGNNAATQQYNLQQDARGQYLNEAYAQRNQGLNEILGLVSGSQVQSPNFVNTGTSAIPTTDIAGLIGQDYQNRLSAWNNKTGGILGLFGNLGAAALGNAAIFPSDRRLKRDVMRVGATAAGQPIYAYRYVWGGPMQIGVMADESPSAAVLRHPNGYDLVDYSRIS